MIPALRRLAEPGPRAAEEQSALHALEEEHEHVHLENTVLFPRVVSLQASASGRSAPVEGSR